MSGPSVARPEERPRCYLYRPGRDFFLPPAFMERCPAWASHPSELTVTDGSGEARPHPELFREVSVPGDADVFLFPWDFGPPHNLLPPEEAEELLRRLPHMAGNEHRHIISDEGDAGCIPSLPVCVFKRNAPRDAPARALVTWSPLPERIAGLKPDVSLSALRADCAFVGNLNSPLRRLAVRSAQLEPDLNAFISLDNDIRFHGDSFVVVYVSPEKRQLRQEIFIRGLRDALMVLCPPGIGAQTLRFYETLHMGRIPVLFTRKCRYPLEDRIDYERFCLFIDEEDARRTGAILKEFRDTIPDAEKLRMCREAVRTSHRFFAANRRFVLFAAMLRDYLARPAIL